MKFFMGLINILCAGVNRFSGRCMVVLKHGYFKFFEADEAAVRVSVANTHWLAVPDFALGTPVRIGKHTRREAMKDVPV